MKRMIAILLAALVFVFALTACGSRNNGNGNVSDTTNGTVTDNSTAERSANNATAGQSTNDRRTGTDDGFVNDMKEAADDVGDAIGDTGRAIGDAVTGNDGTNGAGMTGGR